MRTEGRQSGVRVLPPGKYNWRVLPGAEFGRTEMLTEDRRSNRGDDQIALVLRVGTRDGTVLVLDSLTFSEKALFRIEAFLKSAGIYPGDGVDIDLCATDCVGLADLCETINEPSADGKYENTKIKTWLEAPRQNPGEVRRAGPAPGPDPRVTERYAPAPVDDDIPF